jgi:hypothetical protein
MIIGSVVDIPVCFQKELYNLEQYDIEMPYDYCIFCDM